MEKTDWQERAAWFAGYLGQQLLAQEVHDMHRLIPPQPLGQYGLIYQHQAIFTELFQGRIKELIQVSEHTANAITPRYYVLSDSAVLPFLENTMSLIVMPHVLEYVKDAKSAVLEAVNVLQGQGYLVISGFNPCSFWGLRRLFAAFSRQRKMPYRGKYYHAGDIKRWLRDNDCHIIKAKTVYFRLPVMNPLLQRLTQFIEVLGRLCWPGCGGGYVIIAQKTQIPLTPVWERLRVSDFLVNKGVIEPTPRTRV